MCYTVYPKYWHRKTTTVKFRFSEIVPIHLSHYWKSLLARDSLYTNATGQDDQIRKTSTQDTWRLSEIKTVIIYTTVTQNLLSRKRLWFLKKVTRPRLNSATRQAGNFEAFFRKRGWPSKSPLCIGPKSINSISHLICTKLRNKIWDLGANVQNWLNCQPSKCAKVPFSTILALSPYSMQEDPIFDDTIGHIMNSICCLTI